MAGASIVVDIKAQITGYKEQIENIKNELKKVDPGSQIGKSLNRTLEQADQKLSKLSRNAEQRITSQGQLDRLFDQLHDVSDLMRNLGQGMQSVGLNDVLLTASDQAHQLGQDLKTVQDEMKTKGSNFFEELTKTNPKELQSVFDQLKFDPKTMGVDEFVTKFKEATQSAKNEVKDLAEQQKQAQADLDKTKAMKAMHDQLPVALQGKNVRQDAIRNVFGLNNKGMDQAQLVSDRDAMAQEFIDRIRTSLEADTSRSEENKANLSGTLQETLTKLQEAKTKEQVQSILQDLDKALKSTAGEGHGGSYRGIAGMSGESFNSELVSKLTENTYKADQGFVDQLTQLKDLMMGSSNESAQAAGNQLSTILNSLLNPTDLTTFQNNMQALVSIIQDGLKSVNSSTKDFDVTERTSLANSATEALKMAQERVGALDTIGNSKAYTNLIDEYNQLKERMSQIEEKLGIENGKNQSAVAGGINAKGGQLLNTLPIIDKGATDQLKQYTTVLEDAQHRQQMMGKVEGIAQRWFSVYAAVRMVSKAFRSMKENVTKIDDTITEIAIVTDMSQGDLWRQMPQYTDMARKYGSTIEGVYQVSQLYYQQGLEQADVMALTEQTLKMARISGLDYTDATNYMTNAIRSFKMEMQDAQTVVDVYSALAASSASSTTELATAMSKTASSAAAVGSSFESTSAMLAVMIETTRESPENIGSALKSIISRYGELKENKTGIDEEGEEYSLNKVDTALQSVGISIHDAQGQFRDFDDVIMELAQSWDTIDTNTQRYIATVMAGNRQQSRFLALVSNGERLAELTETAENSEDASTLQVLKTMDSIAYKSQNLQTSLQSLYTDSGIENFYKGILDGANQIVKTFTDMPTLFQLPIPALASFAMNFISIANVVLTAIQVLKNKFTAQWDIDDAKKRAKRQANNAQELADAQKQEEEKNKIRQQGAKQRQTIDNQEQANTNKKSKLTTNSKWILGAQVAGSVMNMAAGLISDKGTGNRAAKAGLGIGGSMLQYGAMGAMILPAHPLLGAGIGAALGGLMGVWQNFSYIWESTADQAKRLKEEADTAKTDYQQKKAVSSNAEKEVANIKKLADAQFDSVEAREKYIEAANKLATDMPELVNYYDAEGNAILDLSNAYTTLAEKRREANDASKESAEASLSAANKAIEEKQETVDKVVTEGITKSINFGNLKGTAKDKWQALKATDNIMGWVAAAESGGGKGDDLSGIIQIANEKLLGNTPGLQQLYSLLVADNGAGIRSLIETPDKRDAMFKQWNQELSQITDPASKAAIDFVLYQLQGISTELTSAFGELNQATAKRTQTIHSNAAEYVNNFIADTRTMAEYGPSGEAKTQAEEIIEMFKGIDNSSEIVTNYLTQQFLSGGYKTWDDFIKELEDPEKSPLLNFIDILNQIPTTLHTELNNLLQNKSQYTKEVMQQKIATLLGNDELAEAIINTYSNYYDNLIDAKEFKKQINKQTDATYFSTTKFFENGDTFDFLPTLSGEEMSTILDMKDKIESMYSSGRITKLDARKFMNVYSDLWGTGDEAIQAIMSRITDFSAEGLEELYTLIDNSDEFISDEQKETFKQSLATLFGFIPQNLTTNLKSYEEQMVTTTKDYSKDISSATKGMDYEAAAELAAKLNIDTSTEYFDVREGELFLKNTSLIYEHYFGENGISTLLTSKMHEYSETLQQHVEDLNKLDLQNLDVTTLTKEQAEEDFGVDLVTLKQLITDFKASGLTTMTDEWISNYFEGTITKTEDLVNILFKSYDLTRAIDSGKLKDIVKAAASGPAESVIDGITGQLEMALKTGDFKYLTDNSDLSDEFKAKLPEMKVAYDEAQNNILSSLVDSIDEGYQILEINDYNRDLFTSLQSQYSSLIKDTIKDSEGNIIGAVIDTTLADLNTIYNLIESQVFPKGSAAEHKQREWLAQLKQQRYETSRGGSLSNIIDSYDNISMVAYEEFIDAWGDQEEFKSIFTERADGSRKTNLALLAKFVQSNYDKLDELSRESIDKVLTQAIDDGLSFITNAADLVIKGTTRQADMQNFVVQYNKLIPTANAKIGDLFNYDSILQGFVLKADKIQEFIKQQRQELIDLGYNSEDIDNIIDSQIIGATAAAIDIQSYLQSDNQEGQIKEKTLKQLDNFKNLIAKRGDTWKDYTESEEASLDAYNALSDAEKSTYTSYFDYYTQITDKLATEGKAFNEKWAEFQGKSSEQLLQIFEEGGDQAVRLGSALAEIQGKELTPEEMQQYYAPLVQKYSNMADQVAELVVGNYVGEGDLRSLLEEVGAVDTSTGLVTAAVGEMVSVYQEIYERMADDANATASQLNSVYAKMLTAQEQGDIDAISVMGDAMGMTYESLGEMLGKYGENLEYWLKDNVDLYEKIGGGKIRITDFTSFADRMGWEAGSEEYTSAFKSYNDGLIELNKKTKESIYNEVSQIESAKVGDQLNLTELYTELQKKIVTQFKYINDKNYGYREVISDPLKDLQEQLYKYRADLTNGILTLSDNANLLGVATTLQAAAEAAGSEMTNELADMVQNILKAYTDAITNGIKGGLNNVQAADLRSKASDLGITNLDFDKTVEGFKLTQKSAIDLYNAIKQIDGLQGKIVFDSLSESLQESNENFATTTALLNHIVSLRTKLTATDSQISTARREEYEAELELAQQIVAVRSTQEDSTWNFMSNKIPAAQNNPLNYAKNLTQALQTIRDAWNTSKVKKNGKAGFMDYTDFYNIVTELNNMAGMGADIELAGIKLDGSLEAASALIQKGAESLTTVDTGEMKVNLAGIGLSLSSGGSSLEKGITSGVESIANAQVKALDGVIAMLELIVAMEKLGDITGEDTKINLGDIFAVSDEGEATENIELMNGFTKKFKESRENLVNYLKSNEDAQNVFKNTKIKLGNDIRSMYDMMTLDYSTLFGGLEGKQKESAVKAYQGLLDGLYQAAISGNYDLDNIAGSLQEILNAQNIDFDESFTLDVGDITYVVQNGVIVKAADWSDKEVQKVIAKYKKEYGTDDATKTKILEAIQSYLNGQGGGEINVEDIIRVRHTTLIQHDKNGYYVVGADGTKYRSGSNGYKAILQQAILSDQQGINSGNINVDEEKGIATATVTYGVKAKTQTKFTVKTDDNGTITWTDDEGHTGTTQQELLQDIYRDTIPDSQEINMEDFQSWIYTTYGMHLKIKPEVIKDGDTVTDPTQDPDVRAAIKEALGNKTYTIEDIGSGHIEVKLGNNVKVKLNAEDIQYDSETKTYNTSLLSEALGNIIDIDTTLGETITQSITGAIPSIVEGLNQIDAEGPQKAAEALGTMLTNLNELQGVSYETIANGLSQVGNALSNSSNNQNGSSDSTGANKPTIFDLSGLFDGITAEPFTAIVQALNNIKTDKIDAVASAANKVSPDKTALLAKESRNITSTKVLAAQSALNSIVPSKAQAAQQALNNISIKGKTVDAIANIVVRVEHRNSKAKGNIGAFAKGNLAFAGGTPTLMGELGPELVVSQGRYFVVGQNGTEFVNLDKDAIVFNHKQTERLFANGAIGSRGKPFTNETNAISFAKGTGPAYTGGSDWLAGAINNITNVIWTAKEALNGGLTDPNKEYNWGKDWSYTYKIITEDGGVSGHLWNAPIAEIELPSAAKGNVPITGPANASASAALAALKQLRAQWQSLAGLSAQDLAGKGGGGGGGGGGDNKNFLKDLERWYDWLQQIAQLEKEITLEEAKRSKYQNDMIAHGKEYYTSQIASLDKLQQQLITQLSLNESQEAYFEKRRKELNEQSAFSALYGFSESGQLYYKDVYADNKSAFEWLSDLAGRNETTGKANYTTQEQYEKLVAAGFEFAMQYDSSGNEIKKEGDTWYATAVQAFWDKIDADKEEMQSLHDSVEDGKKEVIDLQTKQNEILHEIEDNQIAVEQKVLDAVIDMRERQIEDAQDERDAIAEASEHIIDGLSEQLEKERKMYETDQEADELYRLQRQLDVAQRSGDSAAHIADLQEQIAEKQQDMYFDTQQSQIDALQEASDNQLERLDHQIDIMQETLDYEKEFGLLWNEVYTVLQGTPDQIIDFIYKNTRDYWGLSPTETAQKMRDDLFDVQRLKSFEESVTSGITQLISAYGVKAAEEARQAAEQKRAQEAAQAAAKTAASQNEVSINKKGTWKQGTDGRWWYEHDEADANGKTWTENNWEKINDKWYHFDKDGWMQTGWFQDTDGKWYYLDDTKGANEGAMLANTTRALNWNGKVENHTFNGSGVWTGSTAASGSSNSKNYFITYRDINGNVQSFYAESAAAGKQTVKNRKGTLISATEQKKENKARGGYVNHGLYELGELGTETVLTASQTKVLRDNILSNRPDSLISLLKSYKEAYHGLSKATYDSISDNSTITTTTIERAEVNLQIEKLADDYDSKRAANTIMDEMLRIASKTKANNSVRR